MKIVSYQPVSPVSAIKPMPYRVEQKSKPTVGDSVAISSQAYDAFAKTSVNSFENAHEKNIESEKSTIGSLLNLIG